MVKTKNKKLKRKNKQKESRQKGLFKKAYTEREIKMGKIQMYLVAVMSVLGCAFIVYSLNQ